MQLNESLVYQKLGKEGFGQLVAAFYRRVKTDDIMAPMYPDDDWAGAEARLAGFLCFRFGGDQQYILDRGHPRLRMRHAPFPVGPAARNRWVKLMEEAMTETKVPDDVRQILEPFFEQTATFMMNKEDDPA